VNQAHWTDRLSEYIDDELRPDERSAADAHLALCPACAETLAGLRGVVVEARSLESRAPDAELWPGIAARLTPRRAGWRERLAGLLMLDGRRISFSFPQLAAAAASLVVATGTLTWFALERPVSTTPSRPSVTRSVPSSGAGSVAIDRAIEEARRALAADPANPYLNSHLAKQMMLKVRLLQTAANVVTAHG
jgi:anti-sigma factor RsiW